MSQFQVGDRVVEPTYGYGSVISVEDTYLRVQFDDGVARKFVTRLSKLAQAGADAPPVPGPQRRTRRKATPKAKPRPGSDA
jgi:hypothetical protein